MNHSTDGMASWSPRLLAKAVQLQKPIDGAKGAAIRVRDPSRRVTFLEPHGTKILLRHPVGEDGVPGPNPESRLAEALSDCRSRHEVTPREFRGGHAGLIQVDEVRG